MNPTTDHTTARRPVVALKPDPDPEPGPGLGSGREDYHVLVDGVHVARLSLVSLNGFRGTAGDTLPDDARDRLADCLMIVGGDMAAALDMFVTVGVGPDHVFSKSTPAMLDAPDTDPTRMTGNAANWRELPLLTQYVRRDALFRDMQ